MGKGVNFIQGNEHGIIIIQGVQGPGAIELLRAKKIAICIIIHEILCIHHRLAKKDSRIYFFL